MLGFGIDFGNVIFSLPLGLPRLRIGTLCSGSLPRWDEVRDVYGVVYGVVDNVGFVIFRGEEARCRCRLKGYTFDLPRWKYNTYNTYTNLLPLHFFRFHFSLPLFDSLFVLNYDNTKFANRVFNAIPIN